MKSALDTLQGSSEITRYVAETLLTETVPKKLSHTKKIRTNLKQSFKGSYGQIFSLDIYDPTLQRKFDEIGNETFTELLTHFVGEALYQNTPKLSDHATRTLEKLGADTQVALINQLRVSSLKKVHDVTTKFGHDVMFRYRENAHDQKVIGTFDKASALVLDTSISGKVVKIKASITRLNINTGNGRLLIVGGPETVAFGFGLGREYQELKLAAKKQFSSNLDFNNGRQSENWQILDLKAIPIKTRDGKIVKYMIKGMN
ncbi:hypothetical protein AB6D75_18600 [Vibrio splendidus]